MSEEDALNKQLDALNKEMAAKKAEIEKKRKTAREASLKKAESKTLNDKEKAKVKAVFDRFDKDKSGSISLSELKQIATELGTQFTDEDAKLAMTELDTNKDGTLNFEEFVKWWGSDAKRGGNQGLLLDLVKAKILAEMAQQELMTTMKKSNKAIELGGEKVAVNVDVAVGDVNGGNFQSNASLYVLPFSADVVQEEFKKGGVTVPEGYRPYVEITTDFGLAPDATIDGARAVVETLSEYNGFVEMANAQLDGNCFLKMVLDVVPENRVIRVKFYVSLSNEASADAVRETATKLTGESSDNIEDVAAKIIDAVSISFSTVSNLRDYVAYGTTLPSSGALNGARFQVSAKITSAISELVTMMSFQQLTDTKLHNESSHYERKKFFQAFFPVHLIELTNQLSLNASFNSIDETARKLINMIAALPARVASVKMPELYNDVHQECLQLQSFMNDMWDLHKTVCIFDAMLAPARVEEQPLQMIYPLLSVCDSINAVNVITPYIAAKLTTSNIPILNLFKFKDGDEFQTKKDEARARIGREIESKVDAIKSRYRSALELKHIGTVMGESDLASALRKTATAEPPK
eukprot:PhF_6_TR37886/c0_g1_i1/m.56529